MHRGLNIYIDQFVVMPNIDDSFAKLGKILLEVTIIAKCTKITDRCFPICGVKALSAKVEGSKHVEFSITFMFSVPSSYSNNLAPVEILSSVATEDVTKNASSLNRNTMNTNSETVQVVEEDISQNFSLSTPALTVLNLIATINLRLNTSDQTVSWLPSVSSTEIWESTGQQESDSSSNITIISKELWKSVGLQKLEPVSLSAINACGGSVKLT
ncbi:hypothetical protein ACTXT7_000601 [Hymenolepis weldensis]